MSESLERPLRPLEILKLRLHLVVCAWCKTYLKQIKFMRRMARRQEFTAAMDQASPVALSAEARQRITKSLCERQSV